MAVGKSADNLDVETSGSAGKCSFSCNCGLPGDAFGREKGSGSGMGGGG